MKKLVVFDRLKRLAEFIKNYVDSSVLKVANSTLQSLSSIQNKLVPSGGLPGQVLAKKSKTDHDIGWGGYVVNEDILDNSYFIGGGSQKGDGSFPVNQVGQTKFKHTGNIPAIDRWSFNTIQGVLELTEVGLHFYVDTDTGGSDFGFIQIIDHPERYAGKTITFSVMISDIIHSGLLLVVADYSIIVQSDFNTSGIHSVSFTVPKDVKLLDVRIGLYCTMGNTMMLEAAKLEPGDQQTLGYQDADGNWVLNRIPNFLTELLKCKRYLTSIIPDYNKNTWPLFGIGTVMSNTVLYVSIPLAVPMRARPTLIYVENDTNRWRVTPFQSWGAGIDVQSIDIAYCSATEVILVVTVAGGLNTEKIYRLVCGDLTASPIFLLDARP